MFQKRIFWLLCFLQLSLGIAQNYPSRSDVLWITIPDHTNWIYQVNEKANIEVQFLVYGMPQQDTEITYRIGPELLPATKTGTVQLKKGKAVIAVGTLKQPGFLDCVLEATFNNKVYKHHIKVGFNPEKIVPITQMPKDFKSFWEEAKAASAATPIEVTKTWVAEYSSETVDCYLVKIKMQQPRHAVYGYLSIPKKEGTFPVVFSPPGAGVKPMNPNKHRFYTESGVIRFDMEIHGIRPDLDAKTYKEISNTFGNGPNSYLWNGIENKDHYYLKKVYLACVRALDFLVSLPEWDQKNLIAQGGSQGGALALVTTALDNRITACAANHPALSDMAGYVAGRAGGYPHFFVKYPKMATDEILNTLQYYDVVNFAQKIHVPVFMTWGFNDNTCPPTTSYAVYNSINAPKEALITPVNEHWVSERTRRVILEWIQQQLR